MEKDSIAVLDLKALNNGFISQNQAFASRSISWHVAKCDISDGVALENIKNLSYCSAQTLTMLGICLPFMLLPLSCWRDKLDQCDWMQVHLPTRLEEKNVRSKTLLDVFFICSRSSSKQFLKGSPFTSLPIRSYLDIKNIKNLRASTYKSFGADSARLA